MCFPQKFDSLDHLFPRSFSVTVYACLCRAWIEFNLNIRFWQVSDDALAIHKRPNHHSGEWNFFRSRQLLGKRDDGLMDLDFVQMACRLECSGFFLQRIGQRVGHTVTKKEEWEFMLIIHSILVYNVCHLWLKCATYFISMTGISVLKSCCLLHPLPRFMMFLCFSISSAHVS